MSEPILRFRGGLGIAFIPPVIFMGMCFLYFIVFKAFDMTALAMGGFVSLLIGVPLVVKRSDAALRGAAVWGVEVKQVLWGPGGAAAPQAVPSVRLAVPLPMPIRVATIPM